MAFALGQAIANEFARIAALLSMGGPHGTVGGLNPLPKTPSPPPTVPSPPTGGPAPTPPGTGTPPTPLGPIIDIVPVNLFPAPVPIPSTAECPVLTPSDYLTLVGLQSKSLEADSVQIVSPQYPVTVAGSSVNIQANATPVEIDDVFRFRAFGSAGAVPVSFFGRIASPNGQIVPFNHVLTTDTLGTIFTTMPNTGPGMLLGAAASVPLNSITAGAVNAVGEIGKLIGGAYIPHTLLFSGQLDDQTPLSSTLAAPGIPTSNPTFREVVFAGTGATTTFGTVTPSSGKRMRFPRIKFDYLCSAAAANRQITIQIGPGATLFWEGLSDQVITASQEGVVRCAMGGPSASPSVAIPAGFREMSIPLPETLFFTTGVQILGGAFGQQAGDVAKNLTVSVEES